jgi:hypothetical protein
MDATDVIQNINREALIMSTTEFTPESLRALIHNAKTVFIRRNIQNVEGYGSPEQWEQLMLSQVQNNAIIRPLFLIIRHLISNGITLFDVGCADPNFLADCMTNGCILPYNAVYPSSHALVIS